MNWSGGDITATTVEIVESGDLHVKGKIDDHAVVVLVSTDGNVVIDGKIDGHSSVTVRAAKNVSIGAQTTLGDEDRKIDGHSSVDVEAGGDISLGSYVHNASVDFRAHGSITQTEIDWGAHVRELADGDVTVAGKIDGNQVDHGPSRVEIVSNMGSVMVDGKIDGKSSVYLTAGKDVHLGGGSQGGDGDHAIQGDSFVTAIAGGTIEIGGTLGGRITGGHTAVDLAAGGNVVVHQSIDGGATVRLLSAGGKLSALGGIADSSTHVTWWSGANPFSPVLGGGAPAPVNENWVVHEQTLLPTAARGGYWWENWGQTFGYVAPFRVVPRSLDDVHKAVVGAGNVDRPDLTPIKAVGGGWSFTDAALPFTSEADVEKASLQQRGGWQRQDIRNVLEGRSDDTSVRPMDLLPQAVDRNRAFSTVFNQTMLRQVTTSGAQLPASPAVKLIDTRSLASSLQCELPGIRATSSLRQREILFHVEAGITMADLQQLLDHQHPRLAIMASGGSPGATLAGVISTATHGGEFRWPLLVDCVRAIHLVGPGGEEWWIEGSVPVADPAKLQARYPKLDPAHFIGGGWNAIPGLDAQDVLRAVAVSMGTMGVVYSVVLAVREQFGLRQVVHPTTWTTLLKRAKTSEKALRGGDPAANQRVLQTLVNGKVNGTGILAKDNVYVDLAINPFNLDCWIVNREETDVPDDANSPAPAAGDFMSALSHRLGSHAVDRFQDSVFAGRVFDFLSWATNTVDFAFNTGNEAGRLVGFVTGFPDVLAALVATGSVQTVLNKLNHTGDPDRGDEFLGDVLSGFFHALEGTAAGVDAKNVATGVNSDRTGVSYQVGAIGWPDSGLPGRGIEIALDPTNAFTFLQTVLLDDVLSKSMRDGNKPLVGYVSIRVCPQTQTLMGMQQYAPMSVMIEVVGYRSPEASAVMEEIQAKALAWQGPGPRPLLHWGLENDQLTGGYLASTPLGQPYTPGFTRLDAFRAIRKYLLHGHAPVFDNTFTARLAL